MIIIQLIYSLTIALLFILNSHVNFSSSKNTLEDKKNSFYRRGYIFKVGLILKSFLKFGLGLTFGLGLIWGNTVGFIFYRHFVKFISFVYLVNFELTPLKCWCRTIGRGQEGMKYPGQTVFWEPDQI